MAKSDRRFPQNTPGVFYVDPTCIDCHRCQELAPAFFSRHENGHSFVAAQPAEADEAALDACRAALVACPVGAIGDDGLAPGPVPMRRLLPDLWACGYPSPLTEGAEAYLIVRPDGNVLVDVPAFDDALVRQIEALGDLRWIFLTHGDVAGEVDRFQLHFGAEVITHAAEAEQVYLGVARAFEGSFRFAEDLEVLHTPGHSPGMSCLLWRRHGGCLFTGDHLLPLGEGLGPVRFEATDDWAAQLASARALLPLAWNHAFPARGGAALTRGFVLKGRERLAEWAAGAVAGKAEKPY